MNRFIHRPSPALAVALLALFIALGGTGFAATQFQKPGTVIAKAAKTTTKRGPRGFRGFRGPRGPAGPKGAAGSAGATGAAGAAGAAGSSLAYARVVNGVLDGSNSKNVTVTLATNSVTCLDVTTTQAPRNVVAMIDNSGANPATTSVAGTLNPTALAPNCPAGSDALITTAESGAFVPKPFYVTFN
jgi:Collagen triple helix repeat (20 copies)